MNMKNTHEGMLSFGCGCSGKGAAASRAVMNTNRRTVYQVVVGGVVTAEFASLPEARQEAIAKSGRVKVSTSAI